MFWLRYKLLLTYVVMPEHGLLRDTSRRQANAAGVGPRLRPWWGRLIDASVVDGGGGGGGGGGGWWWGGGDSGRKCHCFI